MESEHALMLEALEKETVDMIKRVRERNRYMETNKFYSMPRELKDLIWQKHMEELALLQTNGKLCEYYGIKLNYLMS